MSDDAPKPLRWTSEPPTCPGLWFVKSPAGEVYTVRLVDENNVETRRRLDRDDPRGFMYAGPVPDPVDADEPDAPTLRDEAAAVLAQLDELMAFRGRDDPAFREPLNRLRAALAEGGGA